MRGHDRARDGEAETDAADVAGARVVEPDERLEDPFGVLGGDAGARVLDHEAHRLTVARDRDRHRAPGRRVLDRVLDEVQRRAAQRVGVAAHHGRRRLLEPDGHPRPRGEPRADVEHLQRQRLQVDAVAPRLGRGGGAREREQVLGEAAEALDLLEAAREHAPVFLRRALRAQRHLQPSLERRQWCPQLVRRVHRESSDLGERRLQPREHPVERLGQAVQLVARALHAHALTERLGGDPARGRRHLVHRPQRGARHEGATAGRQHHREGDEHEQRLEIPAERQLALRERHADLYDLDQRAVAEHGQGEHAHVVAALEAERLERRAAVGGVGAGDGRQRERRPPGQPRRAHSRSARGIDDLKELVEAVGAEQLTQGALDRAVGIGTGALVAHHLGDGEQRLIDVLGEVPGEQRIADHAHHDERRQQHARVPERQPRVDGEGAPHVSRRPAAGRTRRRGPCGAAARPRGRRSCGAGSRRIRPRRCSRGRSPAPTRARRAADA